MFTPSISKDDHIGEKIQKLNKYFKDKKGESVENIAKDIYTDSNPLNSLPNYHKTQIWKQFKDFYQAQGYLT